MEWDAALARLSTADVMAAGVGRRRFLQAVAAGGALAALPAWVRQAAAATSAPGDGVLVHLFLPGGNDFLNTVVPSDGRYRDLRSRIAVTGARPSPGGSVCTRRWSGCTGHGVPTRLRWCKE